MNLGSINYCTKWSRVQNMTDTDHQAQWITRYNITSSNHFIIMRVNCMIFMATFLHNFWSKHGNENSSWNNKQICQSSTDPYIPIHECGLYTRDQYWPPYFLQQYLRYVLSWDSTTRLPRELLYVEDFVLISNSLKIRRWRDSIESRGLRVNRSKTMMMLSNDDNT